MGSVYAALLSSAGNEVLVVDRWAAHVEAIRARGLRVEGASGERTVALAAFTTPPDEAVDMVVIAVKTGDAGAAAASAAPLIGPETVVVPIQNGLGRGDVGAAELGTDQPGEGTPGVGRSEAHKYELKSIMGNNNTD